MPRRGPLSSFFACRKCHAVFYVKPNEENVRCPYCGSSDVSEDWSGLVIVIDPEASLIAKRLEIKKPGRYALRVR